jgi:hypothetical protein
MTSNILDILKLYADTITKNVHGEWEGRFMGNYIFKYTNNKDYYIYACKKDNPYSTLSRPHWHWINYINPSLEEIQKLMPNTIKCIKEIALQQKLDRIHDDF